MSRLAELRARAAVRTRAASALRRLLATVEPSPPAEPEPVDHTPAMGPRIPLDEEPATSDEVLRAVGARLSTRERVELTVSCRDAEQLPKVEGAGDVHDGPNGPTQRMFNGIEVTHLGYFGEWMAEIIQRLHGHHEPQEELAFARILERVDHTQPTMMELGCYWAFYSCWFARDLPGARVVAAEPDPDHLEVGRCTAAINGVAASEAGPGVSFEQCAAGGRDGQVLRLESELRPGVVHEVPVRTVADLMAQHDLDHLDVLHLDIQGAETDVLDSCVPLVERGGLRFVVVSTHHHTISGDPLTHDRVLDFVRGHGGHVIAEHTVLESYSGDGLVVGSFDPRDRDLHVEVSRSRTTDALFPSGERELDRLRVAYDHLHWLLTRG